MDDRQREFHVLPLDHFFVDHEHYQRPRTTLVDRIAAEFDLDLFGVLYGSLRKKAVGKKAVALIDGQQRWEAAKIAKVVPSVPVLLYNGLTVQDEAYVYAEIQRKRRQMTAEERVRAMVAAGDRFPAHQMIASAVSEAGLKLGSKSQSRNDNQVVSAAGALERVYAWGAGARHTDLEGGEPEVGRLMLLEVLTILQAAWPDRPDGYLGADIILGLGSYLTRPYGPGEEPDRDRLVRKLGKVTPVRLRTRANQLREGSAAGGSAARYMADAILWVYTR